MVYQRAILREAPRVLSMMDREPFSATRGCCDRTYWAWKFVDFPGSRFQEALCVLSFLYSTPFEGNAYCGRPKLLEWIVFGLEYWTSLEHRDGSFDEAYPYERSLAATAFTTFYIAEALEFLGDAIPETARAQVTESVIRAGRWLIDNDETHGFLSNHLAAAAAALYHVFRLSGDTSYQSRSAYFLTKVLDHQAEEGWYEEYGGADPGYQTHGSFYLARYWQLTGDERLAQSLSRSVAFLAHFIHLDGSLGGEYASRNTQTYYPAAFEMLLQQDVTAEWIATRMRPTIESGAAAGLAAVDAYNYFPFLNNYVFAYKAYAASEFHAPADLTDPTPDGLSWFPRAGLARIRRPKYDAYVGVAKGGVIKVFDRARRELVYSDCGYIGKLQNGRIVSSQHEDRDRPVRVDPGTIRVEGGFVVVSRPTMKPHTFAAFRLFTMTIGRFRRMGRLVKRLLVRVLIYRKPSVDLTLARAIHFEDDAITVTDRISGPDGARVKYLQRHPLFTTIHMGSSRYFIRSELTPIRSPYAVETSEVPTHELREGVERTHRICLGAEAS